MHIKVTTYMSISAKQVHICHESMFQLVVIIYIQVVHSV